MDIQAWGLQKMLLGIFELSEKNEVMYYNVLILFFIRLFL